MSDCLPRLLFLLFVWNRRCSSAVCQWICLFMPLNVSKISLFTVNKEGSRGQVVSRMGFHWFNIYSSNKTISCKHLAKLSLSPPHSLTLPLIGFIHLLPLFLPGYLPLNMWNWAAPRFFPSSMLFARISFRNSWPFSLVLLFLSFMLSIQYTLDTE